MRHRIAELEQSEIEHKQAEKALQTTNERLHYLLTSTSAAIYTSKTSGDYEATSITENIKQMTGYEPQEFIENSSFWLDHVHPEDRQRILNELPRLFKKGSYAYEYRFLHKDGHYMWIRDDMRLIKDKSRKPIEIIGHWIDITESRQAEEALRESEEKYRLLFENANDALYLHEVSREGPRKIFATNEAACRMLGYTHEELLRMTIADIDVPEQTEKIPAILDRLFSEGNAVFETEHLRKDGARVQVLVSIRTFDLHGTKVMLSIVTDITERKRAEEKHSLIIRTALDGFWINDPEGRFLEVNDSYCSMIGYTREELLTMSIPDIEALEKPENTAKRIRKIKKVGHDSFETRHRRKDGAIVDVEVSVNYLPIDSGRLFVFIRDITERKRAEKKLQEGEERFRLAFENANTGVCLVDLAGNLTRVNAKMCEIFGYTKEELERMTVNDIAHPEDIDKSPMFIQETLEGKIDRGTFEKRYFHKKGHVVTCQVSSSLVRDTEGSPLYFISHVHDITERKRAEKELQHSYEQTKNTLVATVKALASTVEMKDQYTAGHQPRVTQLACAIAEEMGLSEEQIKGIHMAGLIHDIGKLVVPAEILNKPGPLTEVEYEMMKMHPQDGYDILKEIEFPWPVAQIILQHQEVMDGSGYPQGLSGEQIMIEARILRVANVIESLTAHRPYRPAFSLKEAIEEISTNRGILYDPAVVDACLKLLTEKGFAFD